MQLRRVLLISFLLLAFVSPVIFFYLSTRSSTPVNQMIVAPESKGEAMLLEYEPWVQQIVLSKEGIYYKNDVATAEDKQVSMGELSNFLRVQKEKWKDSLAIVIKYQANTPYQLTVDVLDQMAIHKIKKYTVYPTN